MNHPPSPELSTTPCCCTNTSTGEIFHLPIASQFVARTRFSPPPTDRNQRISVSEAQDLLRRRMEEMDSGKVTMAAISGPGDPLATPELTLEMAARIKADFPDLPIGLLTLGIGSSSLAGELADSGISYIEMKVEGVRTEILEKLYAWIRPGSKTLKLKDAAALLLEEQRSGVSALKFRNIEVAILTTLYPGYNIDHVSIVSREMMELGADSLSLLPYCPEPGAEVNLERPSPEALKEAEAKAAQSLPVKPSLLMPLYSPAAEKGKIHPALTPKPSKARPNVAVVSSNGMEVDLHLGHAIQFLIYGPREDGLNCLLETRNAPEPGSGNMRWQKVAETLYDCFVLLTASAGEKPRSFLEDQGMKVFITEDNIEGLVDALYGGSKKKKK